MKKSIVLVFVALMLGVLYAPLNAQVKFGVKGGVNIASVHFSDDVIDDAFEGDPDAYWNID